MQYDMNTIMDAIGFDQTIDWSQTDRNFRERRAAVDKRGLVLSSGVLFFAEDQEVTIPIGLSDFRFCIVSDGNTKMTQKFDNVIPGVQLRWQDWLSYACTFAVYEHDFGPMGKVELIYTVEMIAAKMFKLTYMTTGKVPRSGS